MFDLGAQATSIRSPYPERQVPRPGWWDRAGAALVSPLARRMPAGRHRQDRIVAAVRTAERPLFAANADRLTELAKTLRIRLHREGVTDALAAEAFALICEVAFRAIGKRPFDVQIYGGWVMFHGAIAEMATGEGKTLTAILPAAAAALAGIPVHVITVNDYLTARDAELMGPIYRMLGLSAGAVVNDMDPQSKRAAYRCDVTYCTNKEIAFDYLRDRLAVGKQSNRIRLEMNQYFGGHKASTQTLLRGLFFGIVDEADSVLIDEARVPLIISGGGGDVPEKQLYRTALSLAQEFTEGQDYVIDIRERSVRLTDAGKSSLAERAQRFDGVWRGPKRREAMAVQALSALHLYVKDVHYLIREGKVSIIDEYTGRILGDRSWEHGLHQMIEIKEGCPVTALNNPLIRLTYQRFFQRYLWLSGMTGTAREVAAELWTVYGLATVSIPTNRPRRRVDQGERVYATAQAKWDAIVARVAAVHREGRPVLVGTRSVAASELISQRLGAAGIPHHVLNARQDKEEAGVIAAAGTRGRITVATNMAGRGTDILLDRSIADAGGLHVIATERHEARRIDRQLFGRCGRQGDPGSYETILSLEDDLLTANRGVLARVICGLVGTSRTRLPMTLGIWVAAAAQQRAERSHAAIRRDLLKSEEQQDNALAFSGAFE